jgi:hypothetical protein
MAVILLSCLHNRNASSPCSLVYQNLLRRSQTGLDTRT